MTVIDPSHPIHTSRTQYFCVAVLSCMEAVQQIAQCIFNTIDAQLATKTPPLEKAFYLLLITPCALMGVLSPQTIDRLFPKVHKGSIIT